MTSIGFKAFCEVLLNTSSINTTYSSNHTLTGFGVIKFTARNEEKASIAKIVSIEDLNRNDNKKQVAMMKILRHHPNVDM